MQTGYLVHQFAPIKSFNHLLAIMNVDKKFVYGLGLWDTHFYQKMEKCIEPKQSEIVTYVPVFTVSKKPTSWCTMEENNSFLMRIFMRAMTILNTHPLKPAQTALQQWQINVLSGIHSKLSPHTFYHKTIMLVPIESCMYNIWQIKCWTFLNVKKCI